MLNMEGNRITRSFCWQIFDSKVFDLLYEEYTFRDAHFVEADTIEKECKDGVDKIELKQQINLIIIDLNTIFDPNIRWKIIQGFKR